MSDNEFPALGNNSSSGSSFSSSDSNDLTYNPYGRRAGRSGGGGMLPSSLANFVAKGQSNANMENVNRFAAILRTYDEQKTQPGFDPTKILTELSEIIEKVRANSMFFKQFIQA